jgi:hypothetical protein
LNIQQDHIHLVLSIPPKYAVSEIMGYLKGKLSLRLLSCQKSPHEFRYPISSTPKKYVCMICHQSPGINCCFSFFYNTSESGYKILLIFYIIDNPALFYPPYDNVMERSRGIQTCLTRHPFHYPFSIFKKYKLISLISQERYINSNKKLIAHIMAYSISIKQSMKFYLLLFK